MVTVSKTSGTRHRYIVCVSVYPCGQNRDPLKMRFGKKEGGYGYCSNHITTCFSLKTKTKRAPISPPGCSRICAPVGGAHDRPIIASLALRNEISQPLLTYETSTIVIAQITSVDRRDRFPLQPLTSRRAKSVPLESPTTSATRSSLQKSFMPAS